MSLVVLIGGARAGKSALALERAAAWEGGVTFIATAESRDQEMADRIARHQAERPAAWETVEEPLELCAAVTRVADGRLAIVDCLTLWVSNAISRGDDLDEIVGEARATAAAASGRHAPVIVVTNEVGLGIVPANPLARRFRDVLGDVNRAFVERCEEARLVVAGRALRLEPPA